MGATKSQRFAEFREDLPIKCHCGRKMKCVTKSNTYEPELEYWCEDEDCENAIGVGDYEP